MIANRFNRLKLFISYDGDTHEVIIDNAVGDYSLTLSDTYVIITLEDYGNYYRSIRCNYGVELWKIIGLPF